MNASSLAACLKEISSDRRRALIHERMVKVWLTVAALLVLYAVGTRLFNWDAPWVVGVLIGAGVVAWIAVKRSAAKLNVSLVDIAREVEAGDARLNSLLLAAYEEQQKVGPEGLSYLQERVIVEALEANRRSPWGQQYAERRFFKSVRHAGSFAVFVCCLVVAILVGPRGALLTKLLGGVEVEPGSKLVERGSMLSITAKFPEPVPPDARLVIFPKTGSQQTISMDRPLADPLFAAVIPEVTNDFKYYVEYRGGKKTAEFEVTTFEYPRLNRADAHLKFPEFTNLGEKKIDDTRRVSAVEGTTVDLRLEFNKGVKSAALTRKGADPLPLVRDQQFSNVYHVKIDLKESQKLALALKDEDGRTNKLMSEFTLEALPNKEPELKIVFPRGDQRVSALEEVSLNAEAKDDFGLGSYGLAFSLGGDDPKYVKLGDKGNANEKKPLAHLLKVEDLGAKQDQLISYFAWAEDLGPDGQLRRSESDMYFAEVRPFEEIFRQGSRNQQQQGGQQQGDMFQAGPSEQLGELQKQIINATWKIQRTESKEKLSPKFKENTTTVRDSQDKALTMAEDLAEKVSDPRLKALADAAIEEMKKALDKLSDAVSEKSPEPLPAALSAERAAYQALLRLQAKEYAVSRQRQQGGGGGGGAQQRAQRQLDELDLQDENDRYERQSQASANRSPEQQEQMQVLNRLKELSRRQEDVNERLKELQAALQEARTEQEKEELRRRLKRLQEEQQELVQDMDELNQRMAQSKNSEVSDARQQLDKAREQGQKASEQMGENSLGQAASSGARTEKDLKKLTEDFRKATAQQFNDEMRDMRREARDLAEKEKEIGEKLDEMKNPKQRTLADSGEKDQLARQLAQQKTNYANILERMKKVSEEAETAEPLLSQKLYDTVRQLNQQDTAQALDQASEFLKRSFVQQASQLEEKARKNIDTLQKGVDEAADRLLGDEAEALRTAARNLDELTRKLRNEARAGAGGTNGTNGLGFAAGGTNQFGAGSRTNEVAGAGQNGQREQAGGERGEQAGEQQGNGERQVAQNSNRPGQRGQRGQRGERGQQGEGQQPGQNGERGEQGQEGQQGQGGEGQQASNQPGQQAGGGQQGGENQQASNQQGGQQQGGAGGGGSDRAGINNQGRRNFFDEVARNNNRSDLGSGPTQGQEGPITGGDFRSWADQLRDVQEMIDDPDLRGELARVLDRARNMRSEFVRHSKNPQWNLLEGQVLNPLVEVRQRVAEELARRDASTVAPLDRDPVPGRYAELVSRYYQSLGQGEPTPKNANTPSAP